MLCVWTFLAGPQGILPVIKVHGVSIHFWHLQCEWERDETISFLVFFSCISWLYLKKDLNKLGKVLFLNLYQKFMNWILKMSEIFNNFNSLNKGSVWELYLQFVMIPTARFCSLKILFHSNPKSVIPNCSWDNIKESYMVFRTVANNV